MKQTIFITGTSTGFGKLMTETLSREGHTVIAGMRAIQGKNADVARELAALPNVDVVELEVTSDDSVNQAVAYALEKYGKIDVLVNNAAVAGFGLVEGYTIDQVKNMLEVNLYGVLRTYHAVLPSMRQARVDHQHHFGRQWFFRSFYGALPDLEVRCGNPHGGHSRGVETLWHRERDHPTRCVSHGNE